MANYNKWAKNITSIAFNKTPGKCPKCNSDNTDYATRIVDEKTSTGFGVIWCNVCKGSIRLSGMTIERDEACNRDIPSDLNNY